MQARLIIKCDQCNKELGFTFVDTADMPEDTQLKLNTVILAHRPECRYYKQEG